jgi:hypothetical protein
MDSMRIIKSPYKKCCELLEFVKNIVQQIKDISDNPELVAECEYGNLSWLKNSKKPSYSFIVFNFPLYNDSFYYQRIDAVPLFS